MLERLDEIPWQDLQHAYGSAADVPALIRRLASRDAETRSNALWALYGNIYHQGTVYEATVPAVPFLLELLAAPAVEDKDELLLFLSCLADGQSYLDVHQNLGGYEDERGTPAFQEGLRRELAVVRAVREEARKGKEIYAGFLRDPSPRTRATAAWLLSWFPEDAAWSVSWLRSRLASGEPEEMVRVACLHAIGLLGARDPATLVWLREVMESRAPFSNRVAAALGVAQGNPQVIPEVVSDLLYQGIVRPGEAKEIFEDLPWDESDVQMQCSEALALIGTDPARLLPALCQALEEVTPMEGWTILRAILYVIFGETPMPATRKASQLSPLHRDALQAVARSQTLWSRFGGMSSINLAEILRANGLPETQDRLQAFLDKDEI